MLINIILVFILSLTINLILVSLSKRFDWMIHKHDIHGVQKFHLNHTPSIGGLGVFLALTAGFLLIENTKQIIFILWLSCLPLFFIGLIEDLSMKTSPLIRLLFTFLSILIVFFQLNIEVNILDFAFIDNFFQEYWVVSLIFTLFIMGGAVNSINIIDGFNGLMSGYSILALLAITYVAYLLGDFFIVELGLILVASIGGFFIFNFPFGKIFMGDGGAYLVGFLMACLGLMLSSRNEELSNWFVLLIFIYPMYEVLFSSYRKKFIRGASPFQPDGFHLHMLIYKRLIRNKFRENNILANSLVSPFLWFISLTGIIPAIFWYDDRNMLIICAVIFMIFYTIIYRRIVHFKFKF